MRKISVVIPCYRSEKSIRTVVENTLSELRALGEKQIEIILINDASPDNTFREIMKLARDYPQDVIGVDLAKNSGQHNAILAGMNYASGDIILGMDDDMQTNPSQIPKLLAKLDEGWDVVYGKFPERQHSAFRNFGSRVNDATIRFFIGKPKGLTACPMYGIKRFVRDEIVQSKSSFTNLQGLFLRTTSKITNVEIQHFERMYGSSGYTLKKLLRLWSSVMNYSYKPVSMIYGVALICAVVSVIMAIVSIFTNISFLYAFGLFLTAVVLSGVATVGLYVVRMFMIVSKEPQYVVRSDTISGERKKEE